MTDDLLGRKIGGYEIMELIGHGGMATVYRARQISMNRIVAVKVLPRQFLNDATYMQRFNREVKIVAELEHRNIVPVHDYGEDDGQPYIVMRYMSGGSVDDLLREGALELDEITSIVSQIAPALDYAHSKGVLHRDLKPSNVLMDDGGGAYLTDFGIARLMGDVSNITLTTQGVVGTPSYMSPEQAQGQSLDHRSDLYSLGVMLFEMATGQRPFESDTPYGIAVLQVTAAPPNPRSLNPMLPTSVENVILTTMNKRREARYDSAVKLADALTTAAQVPPSAIFDTQPGFPRPELSTHAEPVSTPPPPQSGNLYTPPPPSSQYMMPVAPARRRLAPRRGGNLVVSAGVGALIGCGLLVIVALIAAVVVGGLLRNTVEPTATVEIPGGLVSPQPPTTTSDAQDGATPTRPATQTSAPATNTPAITEIAPIGQRENDTPLAGGAIIYFAERDGNFDIYRMSLATRSETRLTTGASSELYPAVSPDGTRIAFMSDQDGDYDVYVMDIDGRNMRRLTDNAVTDRTPAWSPDGEWLAYSSDTRGDGAHDLYRVAASGGEPETLLSNGERNGSPRWSADGSSIVFMGGEPFDASTWEIRRLDATSGDVTNLTNNDVKDWSPAFTPDGGLIYLTDGDGHAAIALMSADGADTRILYDGAGYEWSAEYSPSGESITFTSDASGRDELYLMDADGSNVRQVTEGGGMGAGWLPE